MVKTKSHCSRRLKDLDLTYPELAATGQHIEFAGMLYHFNHQIFHYHFFRFLGGIRAKNATS